ncbi:MAG: electron transfer flavoprotein subunit beta/FixA family protein, partial [Bacteroidia bacterium]
MKILVAINHVPDTTAKIQFSADKSTFQSQGITYIINPYDEWYALVRAIELKEQGKASHVTLIHVGLADAEATLRKGLALGADDAVRIDINAADTFEVAYQIAEYARSQQFDIILTGKETIQ